MVFASQDSSLQALTSAKVNKCDLRGLIVAIDRVCCGQPGHGREISKNIYQNYSYHLMIEILAADLGIQALEEDPLAIVVADGSPWPSSPSWSIRSNTNSQRRQRWNLKVNLSFFNV